MTLATRKKYLCRDINGDDIGEHCFFTAPFSPSEVASVAREIISLSSAA